MPYYFAKDKGFFDKEGLRAEIIQIRSNLQVAGVASGELDFMSGVGTAFEAMRKGAPLKVLAVLYRAPLFSLESYRRIKQDRPGTIDYIRQSFKVNECIAENSYNEIREVMLDDMIMPEDRLKKALDGPYARSEGEKSLSINEVVDYSILRSLR